MHKQGYTLEEFKEWELYLKDVAKCITSKLKKQYNYGVYRDAIVLYSMFPELDKTNKKQLIIELKNLGVEFYDNGKLWRYCK
ncbi:MAG TPA: hypothetical protein GX708_05515 [Gallicola sp.]|nr:hypothetical protein [Gallicola sp.]